MTFCIGSSNISAFLHAICRRMMQCNNASGVFSLSYAQGLRKPACALWSFNIVLLAWKTKTPGLIWCKQNPCMFKPKRSRVKIQNNLVLISKIMYWVCVRRLWQCREGQGWLLWGRKKPNLFNCILVLTKTGLVFAVARRQHWRLFYTTSPHHPSRKRELLRKRGFFLMSKPGTGPVARAFCMWNRSPRNT